MSRPQMVAIGALIESMDVMDPTRSHERKPSHRMAQAASDRRVLRVIVASLTGVASVIALAGWAL